MLGKLRTTSTADLKITGAGVRDAGEGSTDVVAAGAKLVLSTSAGFGMALDAIETQVAAVDIVDTGAASEINIEEQDALTISRVQQSNAGASGSVKLATVNGALVVESTAGVGMRTGTGLTTLYAGGSQGTLTVNADVRSSGGGVSGTAEGGDIVLAAGIRVQGAIGATTGDVTLKAPVGSIVNDIRAVGWLTELYGTVTQPAAGPTQILLQDGVGTALPVVAGRHHFLTVGGKAYGYVAVKGDTAAAVASGLAGAIGAQASATGNSLTVSNAAGATVRSFVFEDDMDWAMRQGLFESDELNGQVTMQVPVALQQPGRLPTGTVIRPADGTMLQATGGRITLGAAREIGQAVSGFLFSPRALVVDSNELSVLSAERLNVSVVSTGETQVVDDAVTASASGSKGGATGVSNLSGRNVVSAPLDASGENVTFVANDLDLSAPVRSAGATLTIQALNTDTRIQLGTTTGGASNALYLDSTELGKLQPGFGQIVFGSAQSNGLIQVGDATLPDDVVSFADDLVLKSPAAGGEIELNAKLVAKSVTIMGSGHTTLLNDSIDANNATVIADSIEVEGARAITSGLGVTLGTTAAHTLSGKVGGAADSLVVTSSTANVVVNALVGTGDGTEPLLTG
jgi:hypothetical protein